MPMSNRRAAVESLESRRLFTAYYLDSTVGVGSDANAGTDPLQPWASIARINAGALKPGDAVYLRAGDAFAGNLVLSANDAGTASSPVVFDTYTPGQDASGATTIAIGSATATLNAGNGTGIAASNTAGFSINDLNIVGAGQAANSYSGVQFDNNLAGNMQLAAVHLNNLTISGFGKYGITIGGSNGKSGFSNVSITNCFVHDNVVGGIETHGVFSAKATTYANSNVYLGYDTVYNNQGYAGSSSHVGDGIVLSDVNGGTIEHCTAYNNGTLNTHVGGPVGIWAWDSNALTIQSNVSHDNHTHSTADGGGFDLDGGCTNCILQYNYSYNNDGAGYGLFQFSGARAWNNNTVRFNVSENDARKNSYGAITLYNGGSGINSAQIYQNTIYLTSAAGATASGIDVQTAVSNVAVRNNIIQTTGGALLVDIEAKVSSLLFQGNDYWSSGAAFQIKQMTKTYASLSAWQKGTGEEQLNGTAIGLNVNPQFADPASPGTRTATAYRLAVNSPLLGAGLNLTSLFGIVPGSQNFLGDSTANVWNIGAD